MVIDKHFKVSITKSIVRIAGCVVGAIAVFDMNIAISIGFILIGISEIIGIIEEIVV